MSGSDAFIALLIAAIWIGWPLHRISDNLTALRKIAEGKRP